MEILNHTPDLKPVLAPIPSSPTSLPEEDWLEEFQPSTPPDPPLKEDGGIRQVHTRWLQPHPFSAGVYGGWEDDKDLEESIRNNGILTPLQVTVDGVIISGHRRRLAAEKAGLKTVPVFVVQSRSYPGAVEEQILEANRAREKNREQKVREFIAYKTIETARAKERNGYRWDLVPNSAPGDAQPQPGVSPRSRKVLNAEIGKARDIAAARVGMAGSTAVMGEKVVTAIDRLLEDEKSKDACRLRAILREQSINAAYLKGVQQGWIPTPGKKQGGKVEKKNSDNTDPVQGKNNDAKRDTAPANPPDDEEDNSPPAVPLAEAFVDPGADASKPTTIFVDLPLTAVVVEATELPSDPIETDPPVDADPLASLVVAASPGTQAQANSFLTRFVLADGSEIAADIPEAGVAIPAEKVRRALTLAMTPSFPETPDMETVTRSQRFIVEVAELMNQRATTRPGISVLRLSHALGKANDALQTVLDQPSMMPTAAKPAQSSAMPWTMGPIPLMIDQWEEQDAQRRQQYQQACEIAPDVKALIPPKGRSLIEKFMKDRGVETTAECLEQMNQAAAHLCQARGIERKYFENFWWGHIEYYPVEIIEEVLRQCVP